MYADLHVHSYYSDGTDSPAKLVSVASGKGVKALSLVDHDTVRGLCEFITEAKKSKLHAIPGVEISTARHGAGIHILGYFIKIEDALLWYLDSIAKARTRNTKSIFDKLCQIGLLNYSWDDVLQHSRDKDAIYSSDVFTAMKNDDIYSSWRDFPHFYYSYFSEKSMGYVDLDCFTPEGAIEVVLGAGGIPVLAHPKLMGDDSWIARLSEKGLMGIEVYHPSNDPLDQKRYLDIAKHYDLLVTGGSDWHGEMSEWDICIGGCGVDRKVVDKLQEVSAYLQGEVERDEWT